MTLRADRARAVHAMAAARVPQQKIAEKLGIARSTVQRVVGGQSPHELPVDVEPDPDPNWAGKPKRCGGCGRLVVLLPAESRCLACRLEEYGPLLVEAACDEIGPLELKPEHRRRYQAIRQGRLEAKADEPHR